jgi:sugar lactone lactonase YvrE
MGSVARFNSLYGSLAVDNNGTVYFADFGNNTIRKITAAGAVTTLAGLAGSAGSADGTGSVARFNGPVGVAADSVGNIYVVDFGNSTVRKITSTGVVTTLAGLAGITGSADGVGGVARFNNPYGIAVDSGGVLYVTDKGNDTIRKITPDGMVTTLAGTVGQALPSIPSGPDGLNFRQFSTNGTGQAALFDNPTGIAVNSFGYLLVTDSVNNTIRLGVLNPNGYLANLSVRAAMAAGQTLIAGFVVDGGAKPLLVRAAGPVLNKFGLTGVVDPKLTLFNGGGTSVAANDNWDATLAPTFTTLGAFAFDTGSKDAALQQSINGPHTAQAIATGPGAILVEAYDAGPNDGRKLVNLSARFQVGTGDNILIAGFVLSGTGTRQVLIRAVGPKLTDYGVPGALADPQLAVFDGGTIIASNDNWSSTLSPTFLTVGAFALNAASKDAALVVTLQAGKPYTVQVSGVGNTTGEALVEIYALP